MKSIYLRNFVAIAALVSICFLIIALSFVGLGRQYLIGEYYKSMERSAEEVARTASAVSQTASLDSWILRMNVASLANAVGDHIFVTDAQGQICCCSDREPVCEHIGTVVPEQILRQAEDGTLEMRSDLGGVFRGRRYVKAAPILSPKGEIEGYVFVSNPTGSMLGAWTTFLTVAAGIAVVVFGIALGATMLYTRHMARPLDEMAAASRKFARGDFSALKDCPLVLGGRGTVDGRIGLEVMKQYEINEPLIRLRSNNSNILLKLAAQGMGGCFCPKYIAQASLTEKQRQSMLMFALGNKARYRIRFGYKESSYQWSVIEKFLDCARKSC